MSKRNITAIYLYCASTFFEVHLLVSFSIQPASCQDPLSSAEVKDEKAAGHLRP